MSALPALLIVVGAVVKFAQPPSLAEGFAQMGWPMSQATGLGVLEVTCAAVYLVPRTSVLGAILLTGLLGGATAALVRVDQAFYAPVILGVLVWGGLFLREPRLRALIPLRT